MRNLSTRNRDGGAITAIVEKFIETCNTEAETSNQTADKIIKKKLSHLTELVNGYDFAEVIACYCRAHDEGNDAQMAEAIRWLRGEFSTKTEARQKLPVRNIIDDANFYDQLKLLARFIRLAGYGGLLVTPDEMVNLYKLGHKASRDSNYEQLLRILNDSLQGGSENLGFILGGTPEFLLNPQRGLYSYQALQSRLSKNSFATKEFLDVTGPVIRLQSLSQEEFFVLLGKINSVYCHSDPQSVHAKISLCDDAITAFMAHCAKRVGENYFRTPRTAITSFINLLAILEQNPKTSWQEQIGALTIEKDLAGQQDQIKPAEGEDEGLVSFKL